MNLDAGIITFLASVAFISLSGVMMPGPLFAVTMVKGQRHPLAGAVISFGHAMVEFPLVLLIYFGLGFLFDAPLVKVVIGLLGGAVLFGIGLDMIKRRGEVSRKTEGIHMSSLASGLITTIANPYFFIWWATVGAAMVIKASAWGLYGLLSFFVVHWLCDFGWSLAVSGASFKAGSVWSGSLHRIVFAGCGILLLFFGAWFVYGAVVPHIYVLID